MRNIRTKANQLRHGLRMVNGKHKSGASVVVSFIHHGAAGHGRSNSFNVAPRSSCVKWLPVNHDKAKTCHCARGLGSTIVFAPTAWLQPPNKCEDEGINPSSKAQQNNFKFIPQ